MNTVKGTLHRTISAIILALTLAAIAGCSDDDTSSKSADTGAAISNVPTGTYQSKLGPDQTFFLNFTGSNTVEATMVDGGQEESYVTTFVTSGDTIIVDVPEAERQDGGFESMQLKRSGEALEWELEGMTVTFSKH